MNVSIRARRILSAIPNYREAGQTDDWPSKLANGSLGEAIGCYRNPGPEGDLVGIFSDGLAWRESGSPIELRFVDVAQAELPRGKESEGLLLLMQDGRQQHLPITGQRGRFFDSMEVLRFVDRVLQDLRESQ